jgi:hypothetical protein
MELALGTNPSAREIVTAYLGFFKGGSKDFTLLKPLLAESLRFASPLGVFQDAASFLQDLSRDALELSALRVKKLIVDGNSACALYEIDSRNAEIGTLSVTEWFEIRDGKIESITSSHDATRVKTLLNRI